MKFGSRALLISIAVCAIGRETSLGQTPMPTSSPSPSPAPNASETSSGGRLRELLNSVFNRDDESEGAPAGLESDAGDVLGPDEFLSEEQLKRAQPWRAPDYLQQEGFLGWSDSVFAVPKGLETRVGFWRDIYTKFTTNQGVLHDRFRFNLVYETIDFGPIMADTSKTDRQKARLREKLVNERRKDLSARLKRLSALVSPEGLSPEDLKLWKLFEGDSEAGKFETAAQIKRIRFQLGQRDRFFVGIYHSGRYLKEMENIFREEKLPVELTRLPFVESSFNIHARSKVGASGIWQFMRRTARPYLKVNGEIDERNDPIKATKASARLLKQNFQMLQNWPLAITAYNHGANGMRRIVGKVGSNDIVEIIAQYSSRTFGFASENFYACFLAAIEVERNAKKYFREPSWGPEVDAVEVRLRKPMAYSLLSEFFAGDATALGLANPHLSSRVKKSRALIPSGQFVRVPKGRVALAEDLQAGKLTPAKVELALKESSHGAANPDLRPAAPQTETPVVSPTPGPT